MSQPVPEHYEPANAVATENPADGAVEVDADTEDRVVLVDRSHGNQLSSGQVDTLTSTLVENGYEVRFHGSQNQAARDLNSSLRNADAFVVVNPTRPFSPAEADGIESFADGDGRVLLMGDPSSMTAGGLLAAPTQTDHDPTAVSSRFGVSFGTGYLYNMEENANNFKRIYASSTSDDPLTEGVDRVEFDDAAPVRTGDGDVLVTASEGTHLSTTREAGTYGVVVRSGNVAAVGDSSLLEPHATYDADNEVLLGNVVEFLVTGEKDDCVPPLDAAGGDESIPPRPGDRPEPTPASDEPVPGGAGGPSSTGC